MVQNFFNPFNLTLGLRQYEAKIEVNKIIDNIIISYPYKNISETLKRLILYTIAIETNTNAIIIFEEPEIHTFPYYTKFFAERVAIDKEKNILVLDVRRDADYEADREMIPGAIKRNPEQVEQWTQEIPKDKDVVVYCIRGGSVSNSVIDKLLVAGVSARYIEGGWEAYKKSLND